MMGHGHATSGAAAWIALTATSTGATGLIPMEPAQIAAGALVTAGAALLPDADHHNGTIAHSLPPISTALTRVIGKISGGHRHGTHSILGIAAFFTLAWALAPLRIDLPNGIHDDFQIGAWTLIVIMVAFALKALKLTPGKITPWVLSLSLATTSVWFAPQQLWWLPLSVGIGSAIHVAGDMLTNQKCPILWPLRPKPAIETPLWSNNGHFGIPILGNAGSIREWALVMAMNIYIVYILGTTFGTW